MSDNVTRGSGLLESFLAKQRCKIANKLILESDRKGSILDIGCGSYPFFLKNTKFSKKIGLEQNIKINSIEPTIIDGIEIQHFNVNDSYKLNFPDKSFDTVVMLAVFEHIYPNLLCKLLKEINRVLKNNGSYILTTPAYYSDWILKTMAKVNLVSSEEIDDHKDTYNHKKIKDLLIKGGFQDKNIKLGYFEMYLNLWAIAKKNK